MTVRVALAQTNCVLGDIEANLRRAKEVVAEARNRVQISPSSLS